MLLNQSTGRRAVIALLAVTAATSVAAQTADDLNEIVVTAQKRTQSLQDVPLSVAVVDAHAIDNLGAQNFTDLLTTVPGLSAYQNGPGRSQIIIRGVTSNSISEDEPQTQETVGLYLDETPISVSGFNPEDNLFDLERVEVLRGPQGTLYGAGAMSGAIRLVTRKPDLQAFGGKVEATGYAVAHGSPSYDVKGVVNVPLITDKAALRVLAYRTDFGGYIDNTTTGEKDLNHVRSSGVRAALRLVPADDWTIDLSAFAQKMADGGRPIDEGNYTRAYRSPEGSNFKNQIYNGTIVKRFDAFEVTSATSYLNVDLLNRRQLDKTLATITTDLFSALADRTRVKDFTQEVRIASVGDHPLTWIIGGYYNNRHRHYLNDFPVPGIDAELGISSAAFGAPVDSLFYGNQDIRIKQGAIFGEATYTLGQFALTAGLRGFTWHQKYTLASAGLFNGGSTSTGLRKSKESGVNPKFNATYKIDANNLVYVQAAKGFRFGGINDVIPANVCAAELATITRNGDPTVYGPDHLWNYEIGNKSSFFDRKLTVNASAYVIKWSKIQTNRDLDCGFGFRENAGKLTSKGFEFEASARPVKGLTLSAGIGYTDSALDEDVINLQASKGDHAPYVPKFTFTGSGEYAFPLSEKVEGFVWGNYQHVGSRTTDFSDLQSRFRDMGAYDVVNLRAGVRVGSTEASVFVKNLADSGGVVRALASTPFDAEGVIRIQPRTAGVTVRTNF
ncbi:TonB-dependent receptor [Sphingosinicellaceae bacterium]|nr:TonB-dependent receptor [Sphingosinicellaceae bacterium]